VLVTGNTVANNKGSGVMIVAYTQAFTDAAYNPLPRAVTIAANRFAGNGTAPAFAGGKAIAAAVGGTLPPVMWDGITRFVVPGGGETTADGGIASDAPGITLALGRHGTPATQARPAPLPTTAARLGARTAIRLPAELEARSR
jgi:hypothetical protein